MPAADLVVIDLTPMVDGYCSTLAARYLLGEHRPSAALTSLVARTRPSSGGA